MKKNNNQITKFYNIYLVRIQTMYNLKKLVFKHTINLLKFSVAKKYYFLNYIEHNNRM